MAQPTTIDRFTAAIEAGSGVSPELFTDDAVVDATVPNWRFTMHGPGGAARGLSGWFADPGQFEELVRTPLPDGELVEFLLTWVEDGVPHACHQSHHLQLRAGRIARDRVWCGGRWPASLLAEIEEADRGRGG